jgi:hypoxanthine phosphoribosyltransferase
MPNTLVPQTNFEFYKKKPYFACMILHQKEFEPFITHDTLQAKIADIASSINGDYIGQEIHFISILNGAFVFSADLLKNIHHPCYIHFLKVRSYQGTQSTGVINSIIGLTEPLENKHVVILEDIVDTGATMQHVHKEVLKMQPASVKVAALLLKPDAYKGETKIDYLCFSIPNKFVVGYGLDYDGLGRNLKDIYQLKS